MDFLKSLTSEKVYLATIVDTYHHYGVVSLETNIDDDDRSSINDHLAPMSVLVLCIVA